MKSIDELLSRIARLVGAFPHVEEQIRDAVEEIENRARQPGGVTDDALAVAMWNEVATEYGLPRVRKLHDARKRSLRARLREAGGIEGWKIALEKVRGSSFLRGDRGPAGWKGAHLDFLLQQSSFARVMEGTYDDEDRGGQASHRRAPRADILAGVASALAGDMEPGR